MHQMPAASPNSPACHGFPVKPSMADSRPHMMPHMANIVLVFMMGHEIGWNRGSGHLVCSEHFRHLLWRGRRRIEMTSAASAMMLLTTELMAVTMSVHFMLTSFPVDINYYIKNI